MDFQNEYDSTTSDINNLVSTQLSSSLTWASIPGNMDKVSSSSSGYVWGYSENAVYICQLPCTGNWVAVDLSEYKIQTLIDLVTDNTNVYILIKDKAGDTLLLIRAANNKGNWNMSKIPINAAKIFSTNTYIWAQGYLTEKAKCAKPCTAGAWITVPDDNIKITSSSESSLYGTDAMGTALKTDENMKATWTPISGLTGLKLAKVIGESDKTGLYGIDKSFKLYKCEGDCKTPSELNPLDTGGYMPLNVTANDKNLWMTATTFSDKGNVFTKVDKPDYTSIMDNIGPLDQNRDKMVEDIKDEYSKQTDVMTTNKQVSTIVDFFSKFFRFDTDNVERDISEASAYKDKIRQNKTKLNQISATEPLIQKIIMLLIAVVIVYLFGTFLGEIVHVVAFIVMVGGFGFIYYSTNS